MEASVLGLCLLAETQIAVAQTTYIRHYAPEQNGLGGWVGAVREVPTGYLFFADQLVPVENGYQTHAVVWRLDTEGNVLEITDQFPGSERQSNFGYPDAVDVLPNGLFAVPLIDDWTMFDRGVYIYLVDQFGDTVQTLHPIQCAVEDSVVVTLRDLAVLQDGNYLLTGLVDSLPNDLDSNPMLTKVSANGQVQWIREYPVNGELHSGADVEEYLDGGAVVFGYRVGSGISNRNFVLRVDADGNLLWRRYMGNRGPGSYGATAVDASGDIYTWSVYKEPEWEIYDWKLQLVKWDADGNIVWDSRTHLNYQSSTFDMYLEPNGSTIASARVNDQGTICKFGANGDSLWTRTYSLFSFSAAHFIFDVEPTADGGIVAAGEARQGIDDPEPGLSTLWMIRMDSMGCVVPGCHTVGVAEYELGLQERLLVQPNPASAYVEFSLPLPDGYTLSGAVQAVLLDAQGKEVLRQSLRSSVGEVHSQLNVSELPAGLYYLHLRDEVKWLAGGKVVVE